MEMLRRDDELSIEFGEHDEQMVQIASSLWHGFKNTGDAEGMIVNTTSQTYDYEEPDEYRLLAHENHVPYGCARKDG